MSKASDSAKENASKPNLLGKALQDLNLSGIHDNISHDVQRDSM